MTNRAKTASTQEAPKMTKEELVAAIQGMGSPEVSGVADGFLGPAADGSDEYAEESEELYRVSRSSSTRDIETREAPTWLPRASLPDPNPEPGWSFRWIRISFGATADPTNVAGRLREGWVVVRPEEQPDIARTLHGGGVGQDRIVIGDNMLVKIPSKTLELRREYYAKLNGQQIIGVQSQMLRHQDARMPMLRPSIVSTQSKKIS